MSILARTTGPRDQALSFSRIQTTRATPSSNTMDMTGRVEFWKSARTATLLTPGALAFLSAVASVEECEVVLAAAAALVVAEVLAVVVEASATVAVEEADSEAVLAAAEARASTLPRFLPTLSPTLPRLALSAATPSMFAM